MAQQIVDSKAGEMEPSDCEACLLSQDKPPQIAVKKTPLRDMQSERNIVAQKVYSNSLALKEIISEVPKGSGAKRPSPDVPTSIPNQQPLSSNSGNGHLVYVRRKSEVDAGKASNNDVVADNASSLQPSHLTLQEDEQQPKSLTKNSQMQCLPVYAPIPTNSLTSIPSAKPSVPASSIATMKDRTLVEEPRNQTVPSAVTSSVQSRVNKRNWEERYLQLQAFLKTLDQSSLEDHLQMLRSFSAPELSRHAVELEKRAIQLSLEQAKELQRVKALNVLGKSVRSSNGSAPPFEQQIPQG